MLVLVVNITLRTIYFNLRKVLSAIQHCDRPSNLEMIDKKIKACHPVDPWFSVLGDFVINKDFFVRSIFIFIRLGIFVVVNISFVIVFQRSSFLSSRRCFLSSFSPFHHHLSFSFSSPHHLHLPSSLPCRSSWQHPPHHHPDSHH